MAEFAHFKIDYLIHGRFKTFYICAKTMDDLKSWHWAAIDAGFSSIPKYRIDKTPALTKEQAESLGISDVQWTIA
ncbi:DUF6555 family protein [Pseudomonas alliivorans]|uniref:Uncharacterized protein n=1 Tax=Pseudomonas syringae pv. syringae TaxID=321 RepID=A0AB35JGR9_PSESY|nr:MULTISPECIES: DUF6555 family protein [Pseudomonas syringae group]MEE4888661.1 DUF6555 family protein [Pseudomonas alliivorans]MBD8188962.1 hypothetical protein [Pseudomonas viridiflava]MBD8201172.1 hypothetical protein [Pseudomonas viridiflava]MDC3735243.1 hypothetical protein [Pseudomonas syringae pv. syringae]MEE4892836.1 DUF6555 family protein [Pseudomonas alliivorans]